MPRPTRRLLSSRAATPRPWCVVRSRAPVRYSYCTKKSAAASNWSWSGESSILTVLMTKCPACGSVDIHRSRSASMAERGRKLLSGDRLHRCRACGWRGWGAATPHHHAAPATLDGWEALEVDLPALDTAIAERRAQRDEAALSAPRSHRRHRHSRSHPSSTSATIHAREFNRRLQIALFAGLLLVGTVLVVRACGGGSSAASSAPAGQSRTITLADLPALI